MITDNPNTRYIRANKRRAAAAVNTRWSDSQKIEAVTTYMMLGSVSLTAATLQIPRNTLKMWKLTEWWKDLERELRTQDDLQLSKRLQNIVSKSMSTIEDRLEHGDFIYDVKSGTMQRKPVSMKDAHVVARDLQERRDVLVDRHMGETSVATDKIERTLANLAEQFAKIANQHKQPTPVEVTDVIIGEMSDATETP